MNRRIFIKTASLSPIIMATPFTVSSYSNHKKIYLDNKKSFETNPPVLYNVLDKWRPYFEYASPYATVGSTIFAGLSYLSERNQEKRLKEISRKLDLIRDDIHRLKTSILQKIENVQLRNISGGVLSIKELMDEFTLIKTSTLRDNILSESSRLKNIIKLTLDEDGLDEKLKAPYSALLSILVPLRIMALSTVNIPLEKIFPYVENESLEFEFRLHQTRINFGSMDERIIRESGGLLGHIQARYDGKAPNLRGPVVKYPRGTTISWWFSTNDKYKPKFLTNYIPEKDRIHNLGKLEGPANEIDARRAYESAVQEREFILSHYFQRMQVEFMPKAIINNWQFRLKLSEKLGFPKRIVEFPSPLNDLKESRIITLK